MVPSHWMLGWPPRGHHMGKASQGTIHGVRSHTAVAPAVLAIVGKGLAVHWPQRTGAQPARFRGTPSLHVCLEIRLPARETNLPCQLREALCLCPGAPTVRAAGAPREGCYGRGCSSIAARTQGSPRIHAIELMARRRAEIMLNCRSPTKRAYWRSSFVRQWWLCEDRRNHWEIWLPRRLRPAQVPGVLMMILTEGGCAGRARVTRGGCTETQRPTRCRATRLAICVEPRAMAPLVLQRCISAMGLAPHSTPSELSPSSSKPSGRAESWVGFQGPIMDASETQR